MSSGEWQALDTMRQPTSAEWARWRETIAEVAPDLYDMLIGDDNAVTCETRHASDS